MTALWPAALLLLLVLPLIVGVYIWSLRRRRPSGVRYSSLVLVRAALPRSSRLRRHLPFGLLVLALAGLMLAVSRPAVIASVPSNHATIVLAMDVSGSMCSTDIAPTRLEAAEAAAADFIQRQGPGTIIGLVAFSGFAEIVEAPTTDHDRLLATLRSLATGRRTAIGSGLLSAIDAVAAADPNIQPSTQAGRPGVEPAPPPEGVYAPDIIVLLTDGANNYGPLPVDAAQQAVDRGLRVFTIGFGTAEGGGMEPQCRAQFLGHEPGDPQGGFGGGNFGGGIPGGGFGGPGGFRRGIDEDTLKRVADATGGTYFPAESADQLNQVFQNLPTSLIFKTEAVEVSAGFAMFGALMAAAALFLGRLWRPLP